MKSMTVRFSVCHAFVKGESHFVRYWPDNVLPWCTGSKGREYQSDSAVTRIKGARLIVSYSREGLRLLRGNNFTAECGSCSNARGRGVI